MSQQRSEQYKRMSYVDGGSAAGSYRSGGGSPFPRGSAAAAPPHHK